MPIKDNRSRDRSGNFLVFFYSYAIRQNIKVITISILTAMSHAIACTQETSTNLKSQGSEIIFAGPEQGFWTKLYFSNNHLHQQLFPEKNIYFEESTDYDFSEDKKYLKINKITR